MTAATRTVAQRPRAIGDNIVTVASGKGGVGKTFLAITIAHELARRGRRVLLFDGDLGLANIDIQLGLTVQHDLGAVVSGKISIEDAVQTFSEGYFDLIAGRSGSGILAGLKRERWLALRHDFWQLGQKYDRVLLDLGAGVDAPIRRLAPKDGVLLVVATDEPTSLTDAYAFIKLTMMDNPRADVRILVNMAPSRSDGERTYNTLGKACQNFLGRTPPLAGIVRRDEYVPKAIRRQSALLAEFPSSNAAADIEAVVKKLERDG